MVRKTTAVKQESETWSTVKMTRRLRHSGHTQSLLSSAFPIIILARVIHVLKDLSVLSCLFSRISIKIVVAVSTTGLVLLQVVFMVWEIVFVISAW